MTSSEIVGLLGNETYLYEFRNSLRTRRTIVRATYTTERPLCSINEQRKVVAIVPWNTTPRLC